MTKVQENKEIPKYSQDISDLPMTAEESVAYALNSYENSRKRVELEQRAIAEEKKRNIGSGFCHYFALLVLLLATTLPSCKVVNAAHADDSYLYKMTKEEAASMAEDRRFERGTLQPLVGSSTTNKVEKKKGGRND